MASPDRRVFLASTALGLVVTLALWSGCGGSSHPSGSQPSGSHPSTSQPSGSHPSTNPSPPAPGGTPSTPTATASVQTALAPWHLPAAVSREVVLSDGGNLVVLGGLDANDTSVSAVLCIAPTTGQARQIGALAQPTHDAGGATLDQQDVVIGGGAAQVSQSVQGMPAPPGRCTTNGTAPTTPASVVATLPQPRADVSVAQAGGTAFIVGGYDGQRLDPAVLSTTDGRTFRTLAQLPDPVRYAAVAVLGGSLWVLGGHPSPQGAGPDTATIQRVNLATGAAAVVGQLPAPVSGATAIVVGGRLLVLGGEKDGQPSSDIVAVDPASAQGSLAGHLPEAVTNAGAAVVNNTGWLLGGEGPQTLATAVRISLS